MSTAIFFNQVKGIFTVPGQAVRTVAGQGIKHINHRKNACFKRDFIPFQPAGVASTVPFFVVAVGDVEGWPQVFNRIEQILGILRMKAHHHPLLIC